jgi:hypothetical protein
LEFCAGFLKRLSNDIIGIYLLFVLFGECSVSIQPKFPHPIPNSVYPIN